MELVAHTIKLPYTTEFFCHNLTDVHYEAEGCDYRKFRRDVQEILRLNEEDNNQVHYWIGGGDWNNGISAKDRRFDATAVRAPFRKYIGNNLHKEVAKALVNEVDCIKQWCLGYGEGNHERSVVKYSDFNPADYVAEHLNVNYLGYSAGIRLTLPVTGTGRHSNTIAVFWHHGFGAARTKGSKKNMLHALRDKLQADVYMTGHVHEPEAFPGVRLELTRKDELRLVAKDLVFVNGGTYLKNYNPGAGAQEAGEYNEGHDVVVDYAEQKAYDPAVIGHFGWSFQRYRQNIQGKTKHMYKLRGVDFR